MEPENLAKEFHYYVTSVVSIATAFATWQTVKASYRIFQRKQKVRNMENNQIQSVDGIVGVADKINKSVIVKGKAKALDNRDIQVVNGGKGMFSFKEHFVFHLKFSEGIYSNENYENKTNYVLDLKSVMKNCKVDFSNNIGIIDSVKESSKSLLIKNFDKSDYARVLEVTKWEQKKRDLSIVEHLHVLFLGLLRGLLAIGNSSKEAGMLKGIEVGQRKVEAGIKVGASISVLGTIGITTEGQFFIEPIQIFKDRLSYVSTVREEIDELLPKRNLWLLGSAIGIIYLGRRFFYYCKKNNIKIPFLSEKNELKEQIQ